MATLIKTLKNDRQVIFDSGSFDAWCVYVVETNGNRNAPRDNNYFSDLQDIAKRYPDNKVYDDFVSDDLLQSSKPSIRMNDFNPNFEMKPGIPIFE